MAHPIREILTEAGYRLTDTGSHWRTSALYRGGKNSTALSIDKRTGVFYDFVTGARGSAEQLAKIVAGKNVKFENYTFEPEVSKIKVTKTYSKDILARLMPEYGPFPKRGIKKETLELFEAGMATAGKLSQRICFPIYDREGRIIGFTGRWKWDKLPNKMTAKWKKIGDSKNWLYPNHLNLDVLREKGEIIIVESVGDILSLWDAGLKQIMCIFGTSISSKQLSYIVGLDPQRVIIATNNDEDPAKGPAAAEKIRKKLTFLINADKVVIALPTRNDFGDMDEKEIQEWYNKI